MAANAIQIRLWISMEKSSATNTLETAPQQVSSRNTCPSVTRSASRSEGSPLTLRLTLTRAMYSGGA